MCPYAFTDGHMRIMRFSTAMKRVNGPMKRTIDTTSIVPMTSNTDAREHPSHHQPELKNHVVTSST